MEVLIALRCEDRRFEAEVEVAGVSVPVDVEAADELLQAFLKRFEELVGEGLLERRAVADGWTEWYRDGEPFAEHRRSENAERLFVFEEVR
ncbi:MAG: hypothetical protein ACXQTZ_00330 [Candidatus Alkanophagales archaeon]